MDDWMNEWVRRFHNNNKKTGEKKQKKTSRREDETTGEAEGTINMEKYYRDLLLQ